MRVGTKSVLFGAHCFLLHPWFGYIALGAAFLAVVISGRLYGYGETKQAALMYRSASGLFIAQELTRDKASAMPTMAASQPSTSDSAP